jgi:hypothetical protein
LAEIVAKSLEGVHHALEGLVVAVHAESVAEEGERANGAAKEEAKDLV